MNAPPLLRPPLLLAAALALAAALPRSAVAEDAPAPPAVIEAGLTISREALAKVALDEPIVVADDLRITHMAVGRFIRPEGSHSKGTSGRFVPTTNVPIVAGELFGWIVRFDTSRDEIELTEKLVLPVGSDDWSGIDEDAVSEDGTTATSTIIFDQLWDWTFHTWGFDTTDPAGKHRFEILFEDKVIAVLPFTAATPSK
jgi:hypothetical protein